jgi:hypothetical protein
MQLKIIELSLSSKKGMDPKLSQDVVSAWTDPNAINVTNKVKLNFFIHILTCLCCQILEETID